MKNAVAIVLVVGMGAAAFMLMSQGAQASVLYAADPNSGGGDVVPADSADTGSTWPDLSGLFSDIGAGFDNSAADLSSNIGNLSPMNPDKNIAAFLMMIRVGEGTPDPDGYRRIVGGSMFTSFADHPRIHKSGVFANGKAWSSDAAGAYQFLSTTWDMCRAALNLPDFSPASQDLAAQYLIQKHGALGDVQAGRVDAAISKCNREWASLPGSPYGQPTRTLAQAESTYQANGGGFA